MVPARHAQQAREQHADHCEHGRDNDEGEAVAVAAQPQRPRARRPAEVLDAAPVRALSQFGGVPHGATHWGIRRQLPTLEWETLGHARPGAITKDREWPNAELSEEEVQRRWGPGVYEIQWVVPGPRGTRRVQRGGRTVEILPVATVAAPSVTEPAAVAATIFNGPMGDALSLMQLFEKMKLDGVASMVQMMQIQAQAGGARGGGFGAAELELVMRNNREATAAAVQAAVAPLQAELATIRRELDSAGEDEGSPVAAAAASAVGTFVKGKGGWAQAANFAAANPELAKVALAGVVELAGKVASALTPKPAPPAPAPAQLPRAMPPAPPALHGEVAPASQDPSPAFVAEQRKPAGVVAPDGWQHTKPETVATVSVPPPPPAS